MVSRNRVLHIQYIVYQSISRLNEEYIVFPSAANQNNVMQDFYKIANFPGVIEAIDCTHIKILVRSMKNRERFRNRKLFMSINVQVICDANLFIANLFARWPGSVHDSRIFNNSEIRAKFENNQFNGWLLGDNGYACKSYYTFY